MLVGEVELPLVEAVAQVCLVMLLAISQKVKPMLEDFSHFDELTPSVEHFRLQVVVSAIVVLPASDGLGQQLVAIVDSSVGNFLDLVRGKPF